MPTKPKKEPTKTIQWQPPYTDDSIDFGNAVGEPGNPDLVMYKPGSADAPKSLRATGRLVLTLPETVADNFLTHPRMRFAEVPADTDPAYVAPEPAPTAPSGVGVEPGAAVPNAGEGLSDTAGTEQHV